MFHHVMDMLNKPMAYQTKGTQRTENTVQKDNKSLSAERKAEVDEATLPENGIMSW